MESHRIEISQKTIIFTIITLISIWLLFEVRSIIVLLFIAFILMTAVTPIVNLAKKIKIPTIVVMLLIYFGLIALLSSVVASLLPALVTQTKGISQALPTYLHSLEDIFNTSINPNVTSDYLNSIPSNLLKIVTGAFNNIILVLAIFFMSYYLVLERPRLHKYLLHFFPNKDAEARAENLVISVEKQVGGWVRGQILLMVVIGILTYIGLTILGIPYALPLAVIAGLLEVVPNLGPTIAAIPAILMGLTVSPMIGLGALIMSIVIQQLENNLIVPRIMQSATGTAPLVTITVLLAGYTLGGVVGAILGMPIYLTTLTIIKAFKPELSGRS